ncbi:MAG: hypothetical protein V2A78_06335 [bacterium]
MKKICTFFLLSIILASCAYAQENLRVTLKSRITGTTSDPVLSQSHIITVELTNQKSEPFRLNHKNFIMMSSGGQRFTSVKYRTRSRFYGDKGTPDAFMIEPGKSQEVDLTFNLPPSESPATLLVQGKRGVILGKLELR